MKDTKGIDEDELKINGYALMILKKICMKVI